MKKILLSVVGIALVMVAAGQAPLLKKWDHTYGGNDKETLMHILEATDGGFLLSGYTFSDSSAEITEHTHGGTDFWSIRTDSLGNKIWDKRFGGLLHERIYSADQTLDGGFILGGFTTSDSSDDVSEHTRGSMDYWMVKINSLGQKMWDKRFGGGSYDQFTSIQQCSDKGYILGGFIYSDSSGEVSTHTQGGEDYWIIKTDSLGNKLWDKRFGGDQTDDLWYLMQTADNGFILGGITTSDSTGDVSHHIHGTASDIWIVKVNSLGVKQWDKVYGGFGGESLSSIVQTSDHGYIINGGTSSDSTGDVSEHTRDTSAQLIFSGDMWMLKIDSVGNIKMDKRFGGLSSDGSAGNIIPTVDKCFILGGNSTSEVGADKSESNFGYSQSWIVKSDSLGNKLWDKTLFTIGDDASGMPLQTMDQCYVFANMSHAGIGGYKTENTRGNDDFWMIKFCETEQPILPVADFTVIDTGLCAGGCFNFTNNSLNAGDFQWYFPGGNPSSSSSAFPPSVCYANSGNYNVTLIAINGTHRDTVEQIGAVQVFPLPSVAITQSNDTLYATPGYNFYQWYFNNNFLLFDTLRYHVVTQNGNYSVMAIDNNGCPGHDTLFSVILGITATTINNHPVHLYPNPSSTQITIEGLPETGYSISIFDMLGKNVAFLNSSNTIENISVADLKSGMYFIQITVGNEKTFMRFIKE